MTRLTARFFAAALTVAIITSLTASAMAQVSGYQHNQGWGQVGIVIPMKKGGSIQLQFGSQRTTFVQTGSYGYGGMYAGVLPNGYPAYMPGAYGNRPPMPVTFATRQAQDNSFNIFREDGTPVLLNVPLPGCGQPVTVFLPPGHYRKQLNNNNDGGDALNVYLVPQRGIIWMEQYGAPNCW